ncbi:Integrase [Pseudomonas savastanoi pv. glycinea]|nr:Integrase [Pseudomonas savastanoi pv. glycinea]
MEPLLKVQLLVMSAGERYSLLVDAATRLPVYGPNLFLTSQIRNAGLSHASLAACAGCLVILHRFFRAQELDVTLRFQQQKFLSESELDALRDFCKISFDVRLVSFARASGKAEKPSRTNPNVSKATEYKRLSVAANYLVWLARRELDPLDDEPSGLMKMANAILARRPLYKGRNTGLIERSLSDQEVDYLLGVVDLDSPLNPFQLTVRKRNRLIILLEYELGIRVGEALNIRVKDFDFSCSTLRIVRRADQLDDTRVRQPLVKTKDRELPVSDWLIAEVHNYIMSERSKTFNAKKCPYLFITVKSGQTQGRAWSIAGYYKMWSTLHAVHPTLKCVTGHRLRHTWNYRFSGSVDTGVYKLSEAEEEAARSMLMGWQQGSGTAATYNRRHIVKKANLASLELQQTSRRETRGDDNSNPRRN